MPHYFIDILNGQDVVDKDGQDLPDLSAAGREAWVGLAEIARDTDPDGSGLQIRAEIRDADRHLLAAVSLMMLAEEMGGAEAGGRG